MRLLKVKNNPDLARDVSSGAIICTNDKKLQDYLKDKARIQEEEDKQKRLEGDINNLKKDMSEIKELLLTLLGKKDANQ